MARQVCPTDEVIRKKGTELQLEQQSTECFYEWLKVSSDDDDSECQIRGCTGQYDLGFLYWSFFLSSIHLSSFASLPFFLVGENANQ